MHIFLSNNCIETSVMIDEYRISVIKVFEASFFPKVFFGKWFLDIYFCPILTFRNILLLKNSENSTLTKMVTNPFLTKKLWCVKFFEIFRFQEFGICKMG